MMTEQQISQANAAATELSIPISKPKVVEDWW